MISTAPPGPLRPSPDPAGQAEALQRRHLRGFIRWVLAFLVVFAVIDGVAAVVYRDRVGRVPAARAALEVAVGLGATAVVVALAYPDAAHGAALMPIAAAAMLLPYQAGPRLRRLLFLAGAAAVTIFLLGDVVPSTTRAPAWLVTFYRLNSTVAGLLLVTVLLWQYQARWARLVATLSDANQRLDERTAHLAAEGAFDLLITDVIMPGESGRALYQRLASSRPGLRVLFVSGHSEEVISRHGVLLPGLAFLQKPFTPQALLAKVRQTLDGHRPAAG